MYCGERINMRQPRGVRFRCYDRSDGYFKHCQGLGNGNYKCYDHTNGKWEWGNWNERDGTEDGSHLTSIETDGKFETSASPDGAEVRAQNSESYS